MKGKLLILAICIVTGSLASTSVYAQTQINPGTIPAHMSPGTEITYDQNDQPVIVKLASNAGEVTPGVQPTSTESSINLAKQLQSTIRMEINTNTTDPRYKLGSPVLPAPQPGMQVFYDGLGDVFKIVLHGRDITPVSPVISAQQPMAQMSSTNSANSIQPMETFLERPGQYWYGSYSGGPGGQNYLWIDSQDKTVYGDGQVTWYSDTYGDSGQVLQNNDCATKMNYDQPMDGTPINVVDNDNNAIQITLYKEDVGGLPNAVLDIRQYEMSHVFGVPTGNGYGSFSADTQHTY